MPRSGTSARLLAGLLVALALAAALRPASARAHANLVQSDPPAQAVLPQAPERVQLTFSEDVVAAEIEVQVWDAQRRRVDRGDAALIPGTQNAVAVSLNRVGNGVYTVQWKMVSAVDGHLTRGLVPFTVGDPGTVPAETVAVAAEASSGGWPAVAARWLVLLTLVSLTGSFVFVPLMLAPALHLLERMAGEGRRRQTPPGEEPVPADAAAQVAALAARRVLRLCGWLLVAFALGSLLLLVAETATARDTGYLDVLGRPLWQQLAGTRRGALWLARGALMAVAAGGLALAARDVRRDPRAALARWPWWAALAALGAGALLTQSLGSHAAALPSQEALATAVDWVHLLAVAVWVGGLVQFGLALLPALAPLGGPPRTRLLAGLIPRFSVIAGASVAVIVLSGLYQTLRLLGGWSALTEAGWGRALLVKLALFAALLLLAAVNLLLIRPALARLAGRMDRPARELAARVRLHFRRVLLGEVGLAALVLLVAGVLISQAPGKPGAVGATGPVRPIVLNATAEDVSARFVMTPGRIGLNRFDITVNEGDGRPVPNGTEVVLRISTLDVDTGTTEAKTEALGGGRFTAAGTYVSTVGLWEVAALVRRPGRDEVRVPFQFRMSEITGQVQVRESRPAAPLERGRELYQANCTQCHGETARGDGPLAPALNPRPVDLTVHVPLHSDQELHDWIANGIPRTAMPAWKDQFSEAEIQAIINYLRQVAEQAQRDR
jgi:copper transport protein